MASAITDFLIRVRVAGQNLVDNLTKSVQGADKELNKASNSANKFGKAVSDMGGIVKNSVSSGVGAIDDMAGAIGGLGRAAGGIALIGTAFVGLGLKAIAAADQIQDISDATGIGAGRLLNFKQSIIEAGGKAEDFEKISTKLNQTLGEAAQGNEKVRKSFKDLGIALGDANGNIRSTDELLPEILQALSSIPDPATRAAVAVDLLGKSASRLDLTKLSAVNDPFTDEHIANLAKYQGAIDSLANTIERKLIGAFGRLYDIVNEPFNPDNIENMNRSLLMLVPGMRAIMDMSTKIANNFAEMFGSPRRAMPPDITPSTAGAGRGNRGGPTAAQLGVPAITGGTGDLKMTEAGKQAVANAQAQTKAMRETYNLQNQYAIKLNETLGMQQHQGDLARANLQIDLERDKKIQDIRKQIELETANKERDARVTKDIVAELNKQITIEMSNAEQRKTAKQNELTQLQQQKDLMADIMLLNQMQTQDLQVKQLANQNSLIGLFGDELKLKQGLMAIENERMNAIMAANNRLAALGKNVTAEDTARANREIEQAKKVAEQKITILKDQLAKEKALRENAQAGINQALEQISEMYTPFKVAADQTNLLFDRMGAGLEEFVRTGKLNFKDFALSLIRDMLLIQIKAQAMNWLKGMMGGGGLFGGTIIPGLLAEGGPAKAGKPYIVGEKGPELFIPKTSGTVLPNNMVAGNKGVASGAVNAPITNNYYTNNISAIDSQSVAQFFANNRRLMLGSVEMARKEMPYGMSR